MWKQYMELVEVMHAFPHHVIMGIGDECTYSRDDQGGHAWKYKATTDTMRAFFAEHLNFFVSNVAVCTRMRYDESDRSRPKKDFMNCSEATANIANTADAIRESS